MVEFEHIEQVDREFFEIFFQRAVEEDFRGVKVPMIPLSTYSGYNFKTLVRFMQRGGMENDAEFNVYYPCISIHSFAPEIDERRQVWNVAWREGNISRDANDDLQGGKVFYPLPLNYDYQIQVAAEGYSQFLAIQQWFHGLLNEQPDFFLMNKQIVGEDMLGVCVPYSVSTVDGPNEKGKFNMHFLIQLRTYVHVSLPTTDYATVEDIDLSVLAKQVLG